MEEGDHAHGVNGTGGGVFPGVKFGANANGGGVMVVGGDGLCVARRVREA